MGATTMPTCTFFGHRDSPESLRPTLHQAILQMIQIHGVDQFYVGHQGRFDRMALAQLRQVAQQYPHIRYAVVYAYLPNQPQSPDEALPYTHTLLPDGIEKKPRRFAISYRNRWMVEHSDYVIAYVLYRGGAMQFVELAQQKGKTVLNLAT